MLLARYALPPLFLLLGVLAQNDEFGLEDDTSYAKGTPPAYTEENLPAYTEETPPPYPRTSLASRPDIWRQNPLFHTSRTDSTRRADFTLAFESSPHSSQYMELKGLVVDMLDRVLFLEGVNKELASFAKIMDKGDITELCQNMIIPDDNILLRVASDICGAFRFKSNPHPASSREALQGSFYLLYALTQIRPVISNEDDLPIHSTRRAFFTLPLKDHSYAVNAILLDAYPEAFAFHVLSPRNNPIALRPVHELTDSAYDDLQTIPINLRLLDLTLYHSIVPGGVSDGTSPTLEYATAYIDGYAFKYRVPNGNKFIRFMLDRLFQSMINNGLIRQDKGVTMRVPDLLKRYKNLCDVDPSPAEDCDLIRLQLLSFFWSTLAALPPSRVDDVKSLFESTCDAIEQRNIVPNCHALISSLLAFVSSHPKRAPPFLRHQAKKELLGAWDGSDTITGLVKAWPKIHTPPSLSKPDAILAVLSAISVMRTLTTAPSTPSTHIYNDSDGRRSKWLAESMKRITSFCATLSKLGFKRTDKSCAAVIRFLIDWKGILSTRRGTSDEDVFGRLKKLLLNDPEEADFANVGKKAIFSLLRAFFSHPTARPFLKAIAPSLPADLNSGPHPDSNVLLLGPAALLTLPPSHINPRALKETCQKWKADIRKAGAIPYTADPLTIAEARDIGKRLSHAAKRVATVLKDYPHLFTINVHESVEYDHGQYLDARADFYSLFYALLNKGICVDNSVAGLKISQFALPIVSVWLPHAMWMNRHMIDWQLIGASSFPPPAHWKEPLRRAASFPPPTNRKKSLRHTASSSSANRGKSLRRTAAF